MTRTPIAALARLALIAVVLICAMLGTPTDAAPVTAPATTMRFGVHALRGARIPDSTVPDAVRLARLAQRGARRSRDV